MDGRLKRHWKLCVYVAALLVSRFGASLISPILPYFILELKIDMKTLGAISTAARLLSFFLRVPLAALMPAIGYFRAEGLVFALLGASRGFYTLSALLGGSLALFALAHVLSLAQFPLSRLTRGSIISRYVKSEKRGSALGLVGSMATIAMIAASLLGGYLYERVGLGFVDVFSYSFLIVLASMVVLLPLMIRDDTAEPSKDKVESFFNNLRLTAKLMRTPFLGRILLILSLDSFTWALTHGYVSIFLAQFLKAKPVEIALASTILNTITLAGFATTGFISDRTRKRVPFLVLSEVCGIASFVLLTVADSVAVAYVAYVFFGLTVALWTPVVTAYLTEVSEKIQTEVPLVLGVWSFTSALARLPSSLLGGVVYDVLGPRVLFEIAATLLSIETFLLTLLKEPSKIS